MITLNSEELPSIYGGSETTLLAMLFTQIKRMTSPCNTDDCTGRVVLKNGLKFFIKYFILSFFIVLIVLVVCSISGLDIKNVMSSQEFKNGVHNNPISSYIRIILITPLIEEIIFRLWQSFKKLHIGISTFVISYVILSLFILPHTHNGYIGSIQSVYFEHVFVKTAISTLMASSIFFINQNKLSSFKDKYGHVTILISVFLFALGHLTNVRCEWYIYPFIIIMCIPQLVLGTTATYFRLRIGFFAGVLLHCLNNLITSFNLF